MYNHQELEKDEEANVGRPYQQCTISLMDNIADPYITFDDKGISNYYYDYQKEIKGKLFKGEEGAEKLLSIITEIKNKGKNNKYDCITGVSGGVDSTYLALQAKKLGLRPLIVHFDNGWNSEIAVKNVENIITKLGFDLFTLVVDWEEFKDVQLSFLKASVIDIEAITDLAIYSTLLKLAVEHKVKYILSGNNLWTEQVLPSSWVFKDSKNIIDIHNKFGKVKIKTLPIVSRNKLKKLTNVNGIKVVEPLNYMEYNKAEVKNTIIKELDWQDYGGKHYESVFTRFYQGYILPEKFKVDKRKAHLSNLIFSEQLTKEEAILELKKPIIDPKVLESDKIFVLKKFGLSANEFEVIMNTPPVPHKKYDYTKPFFEENTYLKIFRPLWRFIQKRKN
jgi:N-acetyl sugar amidotransferase